VEKRKRRAVSVVTLITNYSSKHRSHDNPNKCRYEQEREQARSGNNIDNNPTKLLVLGRRVGSSLDAEWERDSYFWINQENVILQFEINSKENLKFESRNIKLEVPILKTGVTIVRYLVSFNQGPATNSHE
jgi:hypothetical protein